MQFSSSLKFNHVFRRLYNKGDSCANRYLVVYCRRNGTKRNRIGLTVGAKLGHAVDRNRLRRRLFSNGSRQFRICHDCTALSNRRRNHASRSVFVIAF